MGKFLKALRIAGDCAEIIVAGSILVELYEKIKGRKKKAQVINTTTGTADDTSDAAEVTTTENK